MVLGLALSARLALAGEAPPPPETSAQAPPVLRFDPPTLDLGEMLAGQPRTATLEVTNVGEEPVTVASMKGGCGCTTLGAHPSDPIAPGGSFSVAVTVDPGMRTGIALRKPVHVKLADGRVETMYVVGRVKTVVAVTPDQIEAVGSVAGATARVTLESVDGEAFAVDGSTPAGLLASKRPDGAASRFEVEIDLEEWERAGRPPSIMLSTDRADARQLAVPVKFADAVAMFRLPAAAIGSAREESRQDELLHAIDARIPEGARSTQFRIRLHRESGMLFVHGTTADIETVRSAVRSLPAASGVRESSPSPKG